MVWFYNQFDAPSELQQQLQILWHLKSLRLQLWQFVLCIAHQHLHTVFWLQQKGFACQPLNLLYWCTQNMHENIRVNIGEARFRKHTETPHLVALKAEALWLLPRQLSIMYTNTHSHVLSSKHIISPEETQIWMHSAENSLNHMFGKQLSFGNVLFRNDDKYNREETT